MSRSWDDWRRQEELDAYYAGHTDPPEGYPDALAEAAAENEYHARYAPLESAYTIPPCPHRADDTEDAPEELDKAA